ncbi:MAG TPA: L-2-hydroxyglutarate oxidase [Pirellulales bacterium]|jgi:L-2-hydroxyglutarate oxidase|nr:L-2-hydroxyglutarate oxidase [Pirellulales bacterium]
MSDGEFEIGVIGGGVVGMATAYALSVEHGKRLVALEAEGRLAAHQTGNNSGVIHSGLYYKPGSLKARNCVEGREALYRFCAEHGVGHDRCGKIVVATQANEIERLDELERRGNANGLQGLRRLNAEELREFEPHVAGIAGLHVPETGIADYVQLTETYGKLAGEHGATVRTDACVRAIERRADGVTLVTPQGEFRCRNLICCAGLQADRVARMCGVDPGVQIVPFRGEYYQLTPDREYLVRNLIYPVPDPRFPFLGVHFTRMIRGGIEAGPNAVLALKRYGYTRSSFSAKDAWEMARFPGVWRMAARYWKTGMGEFYRSWSKRAFVTALQRLLPELQMQDVQPAGAGVRAQAMTREGKLVDDFHIVPAERMIHVLNAPSPAATASLSIGRSIAQMAATQFGA